MFFSPGVARRGSGGTDVGPALGAGEVIGSRENSFHFWVRPNLCPPAPAAGYGGKDAVEHCLFSLGSRIDLLDSEFYILNSLRRSPRPHCSASEQHSTRGFESLRGDPAAIGGTEKVHHACNVFGHADPSERDVFGEEVFGTWL